MLKSPLLSEEHVAQDAWGLLVHRTRASRLRMAAAMDHEVAGPEAQVRSEPMPDWARTTVVTVLDPGRPLVIVKTLSYGWSSLRSLPGWEGRSSGRIHAPFCTTSRSAGCCHGPRAGSAASHGWPVKTWSRTLSTGGMVICNGVTNCLPRCR